MTGSSRKKALLIILWTAFSTATVFQGCFAPGASKISNGMTMELTDTAQFTLSSLSVENFLVPLLGAFHDSVSADSLSWLFTTAIRHHHRQALPIDSSHTATLDALSAVLSSRNLYPCYLVPESLESLRALCPFPQITCVVIRTFSSDSSSYIPKEQLLDNDLLKHSDIASSLSLHVVSSISKSHSPYTLYTHDGLSWTALPEDRLNGTVFPGTNESTQGRYCQVIAHFIVSSLPATSVQAHIDEWFNSTNRKDTLPRVHPFPREL